MVPGMSAPLFDLRRLRYFEAIAASGSLSAAARKLHVAQPALTHQIGELERSLGQPVFIRSSRGVELTRAGHLLLEHTRRILNEVAVAENALRELMQAGGGTEWIRMGLNPSFSVLTPVLIKEFAKTFPRVRLSVSEVRARHCRDLLSAGKLDMAVTLADADWPDAVPLGWETLCLVSLGPEGGWPPPPMTFRGLADEERLIISGPGSRLRELVDDMARQAGVSIRPALEIEGVDARKQAVIEGLGSTLLPIRNVARECEAGILRARRIVDPPLRRQLNLHCRSGLDPAIVNQIKALLEQMLQPVLQDPDESLSAA